MNKISNTKHFNNWYSRLKIVKPPLVTFGTLSIHFQIGIYLAYFEEYGFLLVANDLGYKIFKIIKDRLLIHEDFNNNKNLIINYTLGIDFLLKYIQKNVETPF
jgi:hypothetical protein